MNSVSEILARLNAYEAETERLGGPAASAEHGRNIWDDVIVSLPVYDREASEKLDVNEFVLSYMDGDVIIAYDAQSGTWHEKN